MTLELWLALAGFVLVIGTNIVIITKYLSGIELAISKAVSAAKREFYTENEKLRREIRETIEPLKTLTKDYENKLFKIELYMRDNYVEWDTFKGALEEIKNDIDNIERNLNEILKKR